MNSTQNKKISQVKETTMIVGIDVGVTVHRPAKLIVKSDEI